MKSKQDFSLQDDRTRRRSSLQEPTKVFEHGDLWVQRMRRLQERDCLPVEMIFPVNMPTEGNVASAAREVLRDLERIPQIKRLPFSEGDELRQSLAA